MEPINLRNSDQGYVLDRQRSAMGDPEHHFKTEYCTMRTFIAAMSGVALIAWVGGCSVHVSVNAKSETDLGSHHVVVKPGGTFTTSSSSSGGGTERYHFSCGDTSIEIQNEELMVNNRKYGKLRGGESVLVDHGKVFVGDQEREGTPMSNEEVIDSAPIKEKTLEFAGHDVTVLPGSSFTSTTTFFGKQTLTVGQTKVTIEKDELFVNGTDYGALKPGDTIRVENKAVLVSGKPREAKQ